MQAFGISGLLTISIFKAFPRPIKPEPLGHSLGNTIFFQNSSDDSNIFITEDENLLLRLATKLSNASACWWFSITEHSILKHLDSSLSGKLSPTKKNIFYIC